MRFTMHTLKGYVARTHVGGDIHLIEMDQADSVGLGSGDTVELRWPEEGNTEAATVIGTWANVDHPTYSAMDQTVCEQCGKPARRIPHPHGGDSWYYECPEGHHTVIGK